MEEEIVNKSSPTKSESQSYCHSEDSGESSYLDATDRLFSLRSIQVCASSVGVRTLSEDAAQLIADNLSYKVNELLYMSRTIMYANKRNYLTTEDVRKGTKLLGKVELYGHNAEERDFVYIPEADIYVEEDPVIDLSSQVDAEFTYTQRGEPYIQGHWVMAEGYATNPLLRKPGPYYLKIAETILTGSPAHLKVALNDLRTNSKIGPLCPYFLNLVALTVKTVNPRDINLTSAVLGAVYAIAHNKYVNPSPFYAVHRVANSLLKIAIESNCEKNHEDLSLRVHAALLLTKIFDIWGMDRDVQLKIVGYLLASLTEAGSPMQSHYGAIVALNALAQRTLHLPMFPELLLAHLVALEKRVNSGDVMVYHVMVAILMAARSIYRKSESSRMNQPISRIHLKLYEMFGDSVTPLRLPIVTPPIYPIKKPTIPPAKLHLKPIRIDDLQLKRQPIPVSEAFENISDLKSRSNPPAYSSKRFNNSPSSVSFRIQRFEEIRFKNKRGSIWAVPEDSPAIPSPKRSPFRRLRFGTKITYCVRRNLKFCKPSHNCSPSGDPFLII